MILLVSNATIVAHVMKLKHCNLCHSQYYV